MVYGEQEKLMAEELLRFLEHGASDPHHSFLTQTLNLAPSIAQPFIPALALAATRNPSSIDILLSSVASHPDTLTALSYSALDYTQISKEVLEAEKALDSSKSTAQSQRKDGLAANTYEDEEEDAVADECIAFEESSRKERVKLALSSLRLRVANTYLGVPLGQSSMATLVHESLNDSTIWNTTCCIQELLILLPICISCCPTLFSAEQLVEGLITSVFGGPLLVAIFVNNPRLSKDGAFHLAQFIKTHLENSEIVVKNAQPDAALFQSDVTKANLTGSTPGGHQQQHDNALQDRFLAEILLEKAASTLITLCQHASSLASTCRQALVDKCILAQIALLITVNFLHDELEFLSNLLFSTQEPSQWISQFFGGTQQMFVSLPTMPAAGSKLDIICKAHKPSQITCGPKEKDQLLQLVREALLADARSVMHEKGWCDRLHAHLRLFSVLVRVGDLQPFNEEVEFWLKAICGTYDLSVAAAPCGKPKFASKCTMQLAVSFLCLVPGLSGPPTRALYSACVSRLLQFMPSEVLDSSSATEFAVWLAVQLFLRCFAEIAAFIRETLGFHVTVHNALMRDLADAALATGAFSEVSRLASAVVALRPTTLMPKNTTHHSLALKCVEQMIQSGKFTRCGVDISGIISHFIEIAEEPILLVLTQLVQTYSELSMPVVAGKGSSQTFRMQPLSKNVLLAAITTASSLSWKSKLSDGCSKKSQNSLDKTEAPSAEEHLSQVYCATKNNQSAKSMSIPAVMLTSYFILARENLARYLGVDGGFGIGMAEKEEDGWWQDLLACVPWRTLASYMEENWDAYENLLPQWLGLAYAMLPERFLVTALLQDIEDTVETSDFAGFPFTEDFDWAGPLEDSRLKVHDDGILHNKDEALNKLMSTLDEDDIHNKIPTLHFSYERIEAACRNAIHQPLATFCVLEMMCDRLSLVTEITKNFSEVNEKAWRLETAMVKHLVPSLLDPLCLRSLQDYFCYWWNKLPTIATEYLIPSFLDSVSCTTELVDQGEGSFQEKLRNLHKNNYEIHRVMSLQLSGLIQDPLLSLSCNVKVFRTPLLSILLDILMEILTISRRVCQAAASEGAKDGGIRREEVVAALAVQDSAVCQILLEACLPNDLLQDDKRCGALLEGYELELIPMMVEGVPVMVQCLEFVKELLQQSQQRRQVFAIVLIANIIKKHPALPQSNLMAEKVVAHVTYIRSNVAGAVEFLQQVLDAMAQIAIVYPTLTTEVVKLLQSCEQAGGPLTRHGAARDTRLHSAAVNAFRRIVQNKLPVCA
ncbi:hypothetical protein O6H91_10G004600 [Diphasiastrum complanatum]|uniref:Uncharacterized protein n=1 Tax=Diphasiastrum complanatum TaxID=34168 RepID=A0ACC2CDW4_DIPCM|nr:hypothetical protein O6H91_10G004600 [Diphasiastrum complanatum]